jgi:hypothetical protein
MQLKEYKLLFAFTIFLASTQSCSYDQKQIQSRTDSAATTAQENTPTEVNTKVNSEERKKILDALRQDVEKELQQEVKFVVTKMHRYGNWATVLAKPIQKDDLPVNYNNTKYQERIDDGTFDEHVLALLQLNKGNWKVVEYEIGATDFPGQYWSEKYSLESFGKNLGLINVNTNEPSASSSRFSLSTLKRLSATNASDETSVTEMLNSVQGNWTFKGEDDENIMWLDNSSKSLVTYYKGKNIWEYLFFDEQIWQNINQQIEGDRLTLLNTDNDNHTATKTYKGGNYVVQTVVAELTRSEKPYGYKVLILSK